VNKNESKKQNKIQNDIDKIQRINILQDLDQVDYKNIISQSNQLI
jgi:hypothetical protein